MASFKRSHGLEWNAELRSSDIRRGKRAFSTWDPDRRREFFSKTLDLITAELGELTLLGVVIDKQLVNTARKPRLSDPSRRSLELLLEMYNEFLAKQTDRCGVVVLDAGEAKDDANLRYFQNYLRAYSENVDGRRIIEGTFFLPSDSSNMLQIADICASALYRRYLGQEPADRDFERIAGKFSGIREWPERKEK